MAATSLFWQLCHYYNVETKTDLLYHLNTNFLNLLAVNGIFSVMNDALEVIRYVIL